MALTLLAWFLKAIVVGLILYWLFECLNEALPRWREKTARIRSVDLVPAHRVRLGMGGTSARAATVLLQVSLPSGEAFVVYDLPHRTPQHWQVDAPVLVQVARGRLNQAKRLRLSHEGRWYDAYSLDGDE
jgi:hypothetical protein